VANANRTATPVASRILDFIVRWFGEASYI
jgi:hypothetical protein